MAKQLGCEKVYVHCFLDGRDVPPTSGKGYVAELQQVCQQYRRRQDRHPVTAATMPWIGTTDWDRVEKAYAAMVYGESAEFNADPVDAVQKSYDDRCDRRVPRSPWSAPRTPASLRATACIFMNFRPDRAREITRTLVDPDFDGFPAQERLLPIPTLCASPQYDATMPNVEVAFRPESLTQHLRRVYLRQRPDPAAHRRDGEVRPCDLLLQRRRGGSLPR